MIPKINDQQKTNLREYMERAKEANKPSFILAWLEEWPLDEFWHKKFSSKTETFLWKKWGEQDGKTWYVGLDMREDLNYIPFIMTEESVHKKIVGELYKVEKDWDK